MKGIIPLAVFVLFVIQACDQCDVSACENGACEERRCECFDGYIGDRCEFQATPKNVFITSVLIEEFPVELIDSKTWDDDTTTNSAYLPDIMLQIRLGTSNDLSYNSKETYFDSKSDTYLFERDMRFAIEAPYPEMRLTLSDLDLPRPTAMYPIIISNYYSPVNGFPSEIVQEIDGVTVTIKLEYEH